MNKKELTQEMIDCQKAKRVVSKYGITIICDEQEESKPDMVLPDSEGCQKIKKVASKLGYQVVCDEEG